MKKITRLVLGLFVNVSILNSAAIVEEANHAMATAASPLQHIFTERQNERIDRRFDTPDCFQGNFFPSRYTARGVNIGTIHQNAHLWPAQYRKAMFKHGLLNDFIDHYSGYLKTINGKGDPLFRKIFANRIFGKTTRDEKILESRFKMSSSLWSAFQEGLQQNEQLLLIGSNYLKHKIREEKGSFSAEERYRGDLLQDLAWTLTRRASEIMSSIQDVIRKDQVFQAMIPAKEEFEKEYADFLSDESFMAEFGEPYTKYKQCLARFEEYKNSVREFFASYTPEINGVDPVEFQALELIDLGAEDASKVPANLKAVVDAEMH